MRHSNMFHATQQHVSCDTATCFMRHSNMFHATQQHVSCDTATCFMRHSNMFHATQQHVSCDTATCFMRHSNMFHAIRLAFNIKCCMQLSTYCWMLYVAACWTRGIALSPGRWQQCWMKHSYCFKICCQVYIFAVFNLACINGSDQVILKVPIIIFKGPNYYYYRSQLLLFL